MGPGKTARPKTISRPSARAPSVMAGAPGPSFSDLAEAALKRGDPDAISDQTLQAVLTAAVKIYAAKVERHGDVKALSDNATTATEAIVTACGILRAADLNPFDLAMWFHRMPAR
jgi:hypothetical protein